ncbi:MAG TPA: hypothetical protein VMV92_20820 [Streptosporangiaceae bacterium]|nr:hypothetical protein [Streptosporangiaceae bacterium]
MTSKTAPAPATAPPRGRPGPAAPARAPAAGQRAEGVTVRPPGAPRALAGPAAVAAAYAAGQTIRECAATSGIAAGTARRILRAAGVTIRPPGPPRRQPVARRSPVGQARTRPRRVGREPVNTAGTAATGTALAAARRAGAGTVRLTGRDVTGLVLAGEMRGTPHDLLASFPGVREDRLRSVVSRWRRVGYADTGRLARAPPRRPPVPGSRRRPARRPAALAV